MSDIALNWGPLDYAFIALILGCPGLAVGGVLGALLWRGHRIAGAALGAAAGFVLWLAGWLYFNDVI
jgi:Na+/proline symporter